MKKNDLVTIEIVDVSNDGSGIGRYENLVVFVPYSVTGDILLVRIVKVLKNYAFGIIDEILTPSPKRAKEPICEIFGKCGGCSLGHIDYIEEVEIKNNWVYGNMKKIGKTTFEPTPPIPSVQSTQYRNKAIYPLGLNENGRIVAGFYAKRSHRIVPADSCPLHPEFFGVILNAFTDWANRNKVEVYDEVSGKGILRALYIRHAKGSGEVMVTVISNADEIPHSTEMVEILLKACQQITSIILNINHDNTNVILGQSCKTLYGNDTITERIFENKFSVSPLSFLQVNHDTCELLYKKAIEFANPTLDDTILDLYCGIGTIGLSMAKKAKKIIGIEIVPDAVKNARENAILNGIDNAEFICKDAKDAAKDLSSRNIVIDTVIIDPPRKGCDMALIETINEISPKKIVMISCDNSTAARDLLIFKNFGYIPEKLQTVDMFPRTNHVECVVLMSRVQK